MVSALEFEEDGTPFLQLGPYKLKLEIEELDGEFLERAKQELRETPEVKTEAIGALRKLLESEEDLQLPLEDDDYLLKFLRPCKFYHESAYRLMKRYYKFKVKYPKYSQDLLPTALKTAISSGIANFLPIRDATGSRIMVVNIGRKWNTKEVKIHDLFRSIMMFIEIGMAEPKTQVGGVQVIFDMDGLNISQIYQFGPNFARALLEWVQECIPLRLKGVHIVNEPVIFGILFSIFKPFINEKLRKRIFFHGKNFDAVIDTMGQNAVPKCYGGLLDISDYPAPLLAELMCHYEEEFKKAASIGYSSQANNNIIKS